MTLHTAKGLEFPVVYVTGLEEGLLPLQGNDDRDLEEERRLFFVGLTRAKKEIVLTYALMRRKFGQLIYNQPSQFLQEIPQSVLEMSRAVLPRGTDTGRGAKVFPFDIDESLFSEGSETAAEDAPRDSGGLLLREGDRVRHPNFGMGRIISLSGRGEQARAKVRFNSAGEKDLVLKFARLEKMR
jgi:DNA helicase-2/ATP-dependent DNA helicase PcrA